jgi:hypothetical protein
VQPPARRNRQRRRLQWYIIVAAVVILIITLSVMLTAGSGGELVEKNSSKGFSMAYFAQSLPEDTQRAIHITGSPQ